MKKISRILAIALCIALVMSSVAFAAVPSDVKGASLETAVGALMDAGAITGDTDGLFHPEANLTRAQVVAMIVKLVDADGAETLVAPYADLSGYGWAAPYIKYANINGIANGYGDGTFKPGANVTFAELVAFVVQAAGYDSNDLAGKWPTNYINKAKELGFLAGVKAPKNPTATLATKADAALVIYNAMANIKAPAVGKQYVAREDWDPTVKKAINDFIAAYGKDSVNYVPGGSYAVFDCDDTCAIYDVAVMERYHRLSKMQFAFTPEELPMLLDACFGNADVARSQSASYCDDKQPHSYQDWFDDIQVAYEYLWETYGPFDHNGVTGEKFEKMQADPYWMEFATKFQVVFKVVNSAEGDYPSYPWYKYWNFGMTEAEAYSVSADCYKTYKDYPTESVKWQTSADIKSKVGTVGTSWTLGVSMAENILELWKALDDNGIDVWINSASGSTQIRAAVDVLGAAAADSLTGIIAYTADYQDAQPTVDSLIGPEKKWADWYDWDGGVAWYRDGGEYNGWSKGTVPIHSDTVQLGKTTAINNALVSIYNGHGPLLAAGDSAGDFEMLTMYKNTKLSLISNAGKSLTSFNLGQVALYQKEVLGWDLAEANAAGETLFVLQGRDLNGTRSFIAGDELIKLGKTSGTATADDAQSAIQLEWMKTQGTDIGAIINTTCIKTSAGAANNVLGDVKYGFRNYYGGYKCLEFAD